MTPLLTGGAIPLRLNLHGLKKFRKVETQQHAHMKKPNIAIMTIHHISEDSSVIERSFPPFMTVKILMMFGINSKYSSLL
ncbi:MAG: hypothetical protein EAX90_15250 [Candidatus Heimdallarchaeota archaeon]|nr:hypothetical protein [Candidatus Heimdallarchaeota archaeon]